MGERRGLCTGCSSAEILFLLVHGVPLIPFFLFKLLMILLMYLLFFGCRGQEEKGVTEDEMVGWYHQLNGREFERIPGDCEGQGSLACCSPWGCRESDTTEQQNFSCAGSFLAEGSEGFSSCCARGSVVAVLLALEHGLSCMWDPPPNQGSNSCPLHWQVDSLPLSHQGSPPPLDSLIKPTFCHLEQILAYSSAS